MRAASTVVLEENSDDKSLPAQGLLAVHLHRALDGSWYASGKFADKTTGKRGNKILNNDVSEPIVQEIVRLVMSNATKIE